MQKINTKAIEQDIYDRLPEVPIEKQLSTVSPQLEKEYSAKNIIDIKKTSAYSNDVRLWECSVNKKHKLEPYPAIVNARTREYLKARKEGRKYNGCPYCSGNRALKSESIKTLYPKVTSYLEYGIKKNPTEMTVDFFTIPINSSKRFPFACKDCGYAPKKKSEWRTVQSLIRIHDNIINKTSKYKSICLQCHKSALLLEGKAYFNSMENGETLILVTVKLN